MLLAGKVGEEERENVRRRPPQKRDSLQSERAEYIYDQAELAEGSDRPSSAPKGVSFTDGSGVQPGTRALSWPKVLLLLLAYLLYIRSPLGPILGRIDDLILLGLLIWQVTRASRGGQGRARAPGGRAGERPARRAKTPHEVLGVSPGASQSEIDSAYRKLAKEYHPDRVAHLGEELRELAHRKMLEIQEAYTRLRG